MSTNYYVVSWCVQLYQMSKITYQTVPDWSEFQLEYIQQASISPGWYNDDYNINFITFKLFVHTITCRFVLISMGVQ